MGKTSVVECGMLKVESRWPVVEDGIKRVMGDGWEVVKSGILMVESRWW